MVTKKSCNLSEWRVDLENKEAELVQPVQLNIYQSFTYKKDSSWLDFYNELRNQESQQVLDQQSRIPVSVAYLVHLSRS